VMINSSVDMAIVFQDGITRDSPSTYDDSYAVSSSIR
jgi:hypothetical protein